MYSTFSNAPSFFTTSTAYAKMEEVYQVLLERLPAGSELLSVDTSFGLTNVVQMGASGGPALILLHARNSCAPLTLGRFVDLLPSFRIYAIDLPGQPNLSSEIRLSPQTNAYGQWMHELLSKLGVWYANLVGIDLGAYAILKSLQFDTRRIAVAYLITPVGLHSAKRWQHYWQLQRPFSRFLRSPSTKNLRSLAERLWREPDEEVLGFWSAVLPHYNSDSGYLSAMKPRVLRGLTTPIYCFVGSDDRYFSGKALYQQMPNLQSTIVLPNSGYLPSPNAFPLIVKHIRNTFHEHRANAC